MLGILLLLLLSISAIAKVEVISNYPLPKNNIESLVNEQNYPYIVEILKSIDVVKDVYVMETEDEIILYLERYPILRKVSISGNRSISDEDIKIMAGIYEGMPWKDISYEVLKLRIEDIYKEEGFLDVDVNVSGNFSQDGYVNLEITVKEEDIYFFKGSRFEGTTVNEKELDKASKLYKGRIAKLEDFIDASYSIQDYYINLGFFDAVVLLKDIERETYTRPYFRVLMPKLEQTTKNPLIIMGSFLEGLSNFFRHPIGTIKALAGKGRFAVPVYSVREGTLYSVVFENATFFSYEDLIRATGFKDKGIDLFTLESAKENIMNLYKSKGFFDVEVSYSWDKDTVVFEIREGQRYTYKDGFFDEERIKDEIQQEIDKLNKEGYTLAKAQYTVLPIKEEKRVDVVIHWEKGKKQILNKFVYQGDDKEIKKIFRDVNDNLPAIYDTNVIEKLNTALKEFFLKKGYMDGDFQIDVDIKEDNDSTIYTYFYTIEKGETYLLGDDVQFGAQNTSLKELSYMTLRSKYYSKGLDDEALSNMLNSSLFSGAKIDTFVDKENKKVYRLIQVSEDKRGYLDLSIGYNTEENIAFDVLLGWKNLFGNGINTSIRYTRSQKRELYRIDVIDNFLFTRKLWFKGSVFKSFEDHKSYDLDSKGIAASFGYRIGRYTSIGPSIYIANNEVLGNTYHIKKFGLFLLRDYRDDIFFPSRVHYDSVQLSVATGDADYTKFELQTYYFIPLRKDFNFSFKLSGGYTSKNTPIFERFFLGGFRDLRGYSYEEIGQPNGGRYYGFGRAELEIPIKLPLIATAFVDAGNVSDTFKDVFKDIKWGYGTGIGAKTPIGPVKFEVAFPAEKEFYKKPKFYLSVGYFY